MRVRQPGCDTRVLPGYPLSRMRTGKTSWPTLQPCDSVVQSPVAEDRRRAGRFRHPTEHGSRSGCLTGSEV